MYNMKNVVLKDISQMVQRSKVLFISIRKHGGYLKMYYFDVKNYDLNNVL